MTRSAIGVLVGLLAVACSSTTGGGSGGGGGGSGDVVTGAGGAPGGGGTPGSTTGDGGGDGATGSGGDGGAPIPVGDCVSEVSVAGGMCQTAYACDRGPVTVRCGEGEGGTAPCECLVDGAVVAKCDTPIEEEADTEQCWFPDNCCHEALGAL